MEKQTKNIITREWIEKELKFYNSADIKAKAIGCAGLSLIFVPLIIGVLYGIWAVTGRVLLKMFLSLICVTVFSTPIYHFGFALCKRLAERKSLLRGEFDIVTREALYKEERIVHRNTERFIHFGDFRKISVDNTIYSLTSQGDVFYIVHYKNKDRIKLLYSTKMYEYK